MPAQFTPPFNFDTIVGAVPIDDLQQTITAIAAAINNNAAATLQLQTATLSTGVSGITLPANSVITQIAVRNVSATAVTAFTAGTTSSGTDVLTATAVAAKGSAASALTIVHSSTLEVSAFVPSTELFFNWVGATPLTITVAYFIAG